MSIKDMTVQELIDMGLYVDVSKSVSDYDDALKVLIDLGIKNFEGKNFNGQKWLNYSFPRDGFPKLVVNAFYESDDE